MTKKRDGYSKKSSDWLGRPITEDFNSRDEKIGYSKQGKSFFGTPITEQFNANDEKTGYSKRGTTLFGTPIIEHYREETSSGGSGITLPDGSGSFFWLLLIPIGMIVLVICLIICPALWLVWRFLRKKHPKDESSESSFRGVGWIILALFMLVMGVCCSVATAFFFYTTLVPPHSGLLAFLMVLSWSLSLVIGGIDILRQNRAYTILCVVGVLTALDIFGFYLRSRHDNTQVSTPQISQLQNTIVKLPHIVSKKMDLKQQLAGRWVSVDGKSYIDFNKDGSCLNGGLWADGNWHLERSTLLIRKTGGDFFCGSGSLTLIGEDTVTRDYGMGGEPEVFHRAESVNTAAVRVATVFDPPSNIRSAPSAASSIICSIDATKSIRILGAEGVWYKTDACYGKLGYINRKQIRF